MSLNWKRCVMRSINWCRFVRSVLPWYLIIATVVLMGLGGCGLIEERESTSYHIPNWTTDGEIIALKTWMKHRKTLITNSEPVGLRETVVLMGPNGQNERELFEISLGSPEVIEMSDKGTYVAILNGALLHLYNRNGDLLKTLKIDLHVTVLDFSPDETKLYISIGSSEMKIYVLPNMTVEEENSFGGEGGFVDSINIVYYDWENSKMSLYNTETNVKTLQAVQLVPEIYSVITNKVHTIGSNVIYTYELGSPNYTEAEISYAPYEQGDFTGKQLSPDGKRIVMGTHSFFNSAGAGIYILDFDSDEGIVRLR